LIDHLIYNIVDEIYIFKIKLEFKNNKIIFWVRNHFLTNHLNIKCFINTKVGQSIDKGLYTGSFYGAVRKLTFLKKLILILMFDSFLNGWLLINDQ